jgi:exosome complex exonuclease DIS3/RRP44
MKDSLTESIRQLNSLAKILKQRRIDAGALTLASPEVRFKLERETQDPVDIGQLLPHLLECNSPP